MPRNSPARAFSDYIRDCLRWTGSHIWMTPFAPYILSEYFVSDEIYSLKLRYLNTRSRDLRRVHRVTTRTVVYVQLSLLDEFESLHLHKLQDDFILIVGQWKLSKTTESLALRRISQNRFLKQVFCQNLQLLDEKFSVFPYGVDFFTIPVLLGVKMTTFTRKSIRVLVPFARVHEHLDLEQKTTRELLKSLMEAPLPLGAYLRRLGKARYVIAPAGDRPDTYRHWESLVMGASPVGVYPEPFEAMYGNRGIRVEDILSASRGDLPSVPKRALEKTEFLSYWRKRVLDSFFSESRPK